MARSREESVGPPDLILLSSTILTPSSALPRQAAVVVRDGLITHVASQDEAVSLRGPRTVVLEFPGKCVVPGFHDAHIHLLACAANRLGVDCGPGAVSSISGIQQAIQQRAHSLPAGTWIRAGNYDEFRLAERRHPTRWDLDVAATEHPVKLQHRSLHASVLNSVALQRVGMLGARSQYPRDLSDGTDRTSQESDGLLYEQDDVLNAITPIAEEELRGSLRVVLSDLLAEGITSVHDATFRNGLADWNRLRDVCAEAGLRPRIGFMVGLPNVEQFAAAGLAPGFGDEWLRIGGAKAMLTEADGCFRPSTEELGAQVRHARRLGYWVAVHAVEESCVCVAVEALAGTAFRSSAIAHRIEHASIVPPPLVDRMAEARVAVVTQPGFIYHSGDRYLADVEEHLHPWLYPLRSLLKKGIPVGAGSDAPVAPARPLEGICAAATRMSSGERGVGQREKITVEQALGLYTSGSALACGEAGSKGAIQPGKLADLVVLSADLVQIAPYDIKNVEVEMTIVGGIVAWAKGGTIEV
ncbi:MAG: amidohydrolase [Chloroflexi bacterium]|nr:amidohydrolase [Chloroflexota bacterium]